MSISKIFMQGWPQKYLAWLVFSESVLLNTENLNQTLRKPFIVLGGLSLLHLLLRQISLLPRRLAFLLLLVLTGRLKTQRS
jgi:hypothetical protein